MSIIRQFLTSMTNDSKKNDSAPHPKIAIHLKQPFVNSISFFGPLDCSLKYLLTWHLSSNTVQCSSSVVVKDGQGGI